MNLIFYKYKLLIYMIANCGFITPYIANKYYKLTSKELSFLCSKNLLKCKGTFLLYGKATKILILTSESKSFLSKHSKLIYKSDTSQLEHDYLLLKTYCNLPIEVQMSWLNESELKSIYKKQSTTDALFTIKNKKIAVEVLTSSYTEDIIQEKTNFANDYCNDLIILKTTKAIKGRNKNLC